MEIYKILLSLNEPAFIQFRDPKRFAGQPEYIDLPPAVLPKKMLEAYQTVFTALTGEDMPSDVFIRAKNHPEKGITKLYGPACYRSAEVDNQVVIRWGETFIPLTLSKGSIVGPVENEDVSYSFSYERIQYDEPLLLVKVDVGDDLVVLPVVLKTVDYNSPIKEDEINLMERYLSKGKIENILNMLATPGNGGGNGDPVDPREMTSGGRFTITHAKPINTSHGSSYILTVKPQVGDPQISERGDVWDMWGSNGINAYVDAGAVLPFDFELDLVPGKKDPSKKVAKFEPIDVKYSSDAEIVDLDAILA